MKTKTSYSVIRLMAAALIALTSLSVTSCDKDDDNPSLLVGRWERSWNGGNGTTVTESYYFDEDGWGTYSEYTSSGLSGSFKYVAESGTIHFSMVYYKYAGNGSWKDEFTWKYRIKGNTLTLDGNEFTLKSRE